MTSLSLAAVSRHAHPRVLLAGSFLASLFFSLFPAKAQDSITLSPEPSPSQAKSQPYAPADLPTVRVNVNLVQVPVVVRDSAGNPVGDLLKDSFQIFDNNKLQDINQFTLERFDASPSPGSPATPPSGRFVPPTRFTVLLFDDVHLSAGTLPGLRNAAVTRFSTNLYPSERVAIFTTSGKQTLDFTDNRGKILDALKQLRLNPLPNSQIYDCLDISHEAANRIIERGDLDERNAAIGQAMTNCGIKQPKMARGMVMATSERQLQLGDSSTMLVLRALAAAMERLSLTPGQRSIVLLSPGFLISDREHSEYQIIDLAARNRIVINSLDARGLSMDNSEPEDLNPLAQFADGTGGTFLRGKNDLAESIRRLSSIPESIYMLSFSPNSLKNDGSFHTITVKIVGRDHLVVKSRQGYFAPKSPSEAAPSDRYDISSAVFSRDEIRELPIQLRTQFVKGDDPTAKLTVRALVDLRDLPHAQADGQNKNELHIVAAVFDRNGKYLGSLDREVPIEWPNSAAGVLTAANYEFILDPGDYLVRLVVRDAQSQQVFTEDSVVRIP